MGLHAGLQVAYGCIFKFSEFEHGEVGYDFTRISPELNAAFQDHLRSDLDEHVAPERLREYIMHVGAVLDDLGVSITPLGSFEGPSHFVLGVSLEGSYSYGIGEVGHIPISEVQKAIQTLEELKLKGWKLPELDLITNLYYS